MRRDPAPRLPEFSPACARRSSLRSHARADSRRGPRLTSLAGAALLLSSLLLAGASSARAQDRTQDDDPIINVSIAVGRSSPIVLPVAITRVSVAVPEIADVVVVGEREIVINAKSVGETDAIVWPRTGARQHYRISVHTPAERQQIALQVKFAEIRRDVLRQLGVSLYYHGSGITTGTGVGGTNGVTITTDPNTGATGAIFPSTQGFGTIVTNFDTRRLLAAIDVEEQNGNARLLAEPTLLAGNRDSATFLAGGEIPVPVPQGNNGNGFTAVVITFREYGVRLTFKPEIVSDSLVKLSVRPEVSTLDYNNAVTISGFRVPALRTRRMESRLDVRRDESMVISGLFNDEEVRTRTGIPVLKDIPILGALFSSSNFQRNETELLIVVTPVVLDAMAPRAPYSLRVPADSVLPSPDVLRRHPSSETRGRHWWWPWSRDFDPAAPPRQP
jgi:pilus assembly protein CpaC